MRKKARCERKKWLGEEIRNDAEENDEYIREFNFLWRSPWRRPSEIKYKMKTTTEVLIHHFLRNSRRGNKKAKLEKTAPKIPLAGTGSSRIGVSLHSERKKSCAPPIFRLSATFDWLM